MDAIEKRTIAKVSLRLVPFLMLCYFVAYLDRVNVGFAALTMNKELGISASAFGLGAGIFFLGYFVFEVPSNLMLESFGARKWIARIMFTWGVLSGLHGASYRRRMTSFYIDPHCCWASAEAGFFPGIIFYLTLWFPGGLPCPHHRLVHGGDPAVVGDRRAGIRLHARTWTGSRPRRLAVAVHPRSGAGAHARGGGVVLSDRPARPTRTGWRPDERRWLSDAAGGRAPQREAAQKLERVAGAGRPAGPAAGLRLFRRRGTNYGAELLPAADRQGVSA